RRDCAPFMVLSVIHAVFPVGISPRSVTLARIGTFAVNRKVRRVDTEGSGASVLCNKRPCMGRRRLIRGIIWAGLVGAGCWASLTDETGTSDERSETSIDTVLPLGPSTPAKDIVLPVVSIELLPLEPKPTTSEPALAKSPLILSWTRLLAVLDRVRRMSEGWVAALAHATGSVRIGEPTTAGYQAPTPLSPKVAELAAP